MRKALAPPGRSTSKQGNQPAKDVVRSPTALRNPASRRESAAPQGTALPQSFAAIPKLASQEVTTEENPQRTPSLPLQRKLAIGAVNDPLEAEADAIADRVVGDPWHLRPISVRLPCAANVPARVLVNPARNAKRKRTRSNEKRPQPLRRQTRRLLFTTCSARPASRWIPRHVPLWNHASGGISVG